MTFHQTIEPLLLTPKLMRPRRRSGPFVAFGFWGVLIYALVTGLVWTMALMFTISWDFAVIAYVGAGYAITAAIRKIKGRRAVNAST